MKIKSGYDERQAPSDEFIRSIRDCFTVEAEVDRVLTRKMELRSGGVFQTPTLDEMEVSLKALIGSQLTQQFEIRNCRWLGGGAAKIQMALDLDWHGISDNEPRHTTSMVVRMAPAESTLETSRRREYQLLQAVHNLLPTPTCYWIDDAAEFFPYPAMVYGFIKGVAKPTSSQHEQVTGIGNDFSAEWRETLGPQMAKDLATLHAADVESMDLSYFEKPDIGSNRGILKQIDWWLRVWQEDREEEEALIGVAAAWLKANAPVLDKVSIVHGDFRSGNFLFSEETREITAWLDWEICVLGDRHQDLAWASAREFGTFAEDGSTFLASGLITPEKLFDQYSRHSGLNVDPERLEYFRIYNLWFSVIICLATSHRSAKGGKSHQDTVLTWLSGFGYLLLGQLRLALTEKL